jgi:hypothetical protein
LSRGRFARSMTPAGRLEGVGVDAHGEPPGGSMALWCLAPQLGACPRVDARH